MKKFNQDELILHHGEDVDKSYVAYDGKVYDLSGSKKWKNGTHMRVHHAGAELTEAMLNAPHGPELLEDFEVVGQYEAKKSSAWKKFIYKILDFNPHSISTHFSVSFLSMSPVFLLAYLFLPSIDVLEKLSFYFVFIGFFFAPVSILLGLFSWWYKYSRDLTGVFRWKIKYSVLLFITSAICVEWRFHSPLLITSKQNFFQLYLLLNFSIFVYTLLLGRIGGKIVFPSVPSKKWAGDNAAKIMIEILTAAIPREKDAYYFYKDLAKLTKNPKEKTVMDFLAHEEKIHEVKLQKILDDLKENR